VSQHTYSADRPIWTAAAAPLRRQDELIDLCQAVLEHCNVLDQVLASRLLQRYDMSHIIASYLYQWLQPQACLNVAMMI
jgi:hypothetical protein